MAGIVFGNDYSRQQEKFIPKDIPGLTDFVTLNIHQDSYGFLWFTTEDGLYRYDGYRAQAFGIIHRIAGR